MQPIPSARARVLILTLISPSTGVAAGARGGGAQEGARAVALAAPMATPRVPCTPHSWTVLFGIGILHLGIQDSALEF